MHFVSRAGEKLCSAISKFQISLDHMICADLGCSTGGFTDCLLQNGATRVYSVDTGYGVLDWKLRNDPRVVVMERTNAMHLQLPELVDFASIDVGWTLQKLILPQTLTLLREGGEIVTLVKPHYELKKPVVTDKEAHEAVNSVIGLSHELGFELMGQAESPLLGKKGGNKEFLLWIKKIG